MNAPFKMCKCKRCEKYFTLHVGQEWFADIDMCEPCNGASGNIYIRRKIRLWDIIGEQNV